MSDLPTVGFAGMTHLGIVSSAATSGKGFRTVCYDPDETLVGRLRKRELPVNEPGLADLVRQNGERQVFTSAAGDLSACDLVYVSCDVPTDAQGQSDLAPVRELVDTVGGHLKAGAVLVVLSQVPPGFTRSLTRVPAGQLYYQVETLVFGRAVERATSPERFILGCSDPAAIAPQLRTVLEAFACPILPMRYESAELAKIAINCFLAASVGVTNTLAELCEETGAVWSEIAPALRLDRRIGPHAYLAPGLGIAGGNIERDLSTVIGLSERYRTDAAIVRSLIGNSHHRLGWPVRALRAAFGDRLPAATVAVWGLAYKENTASTRNSPSLATIAALPNVRLRLHDPVVRGVVKHHPGATELQDALSTIAGADALMILTPWPEYRRIAPTEIAARLAGNVVLDPFGVLDRDLAAAAGLDYWTLGARRGR